ncbi:Hyaluronan mediated motility receptor [Symbiodinium microadriaticum]|uniref:Hyaluronan mediated motility receptor n=1 Tax=Symbiodinium microadriaticum TaxID=2951 RepID=A0A1Q9DZF9_SYMMI|nr:Hyaluronan mediated motility receptor [Symbiodinium microadriaticum]CAE7362623.1 Hmmr [Symbiodinium microadriaticum]
MGCRVASDALEARQLHFECAEWIAGTDTSGTSKREESTLRATSASVIRMAEVLRSEGMIKRAMPQASQLRELCLQATGQSDPLLREPVLERQSSLGDKLTAAVLQQLDFRSSPDWLPLARRSSLSCIAAAAGEEDVTKAADGELISSAIDAWCASSLEPWQRKVPQGAGRVVGAESFEVATAAAPAAAAALRPIFMVHDRSNHAERGALLQLLRLLAQEASLAALKLEIAEASSTLEAAQQETLLWKQRAEILLGRRKAAMAVASRWHGADAAWDWLMEQGQGPQELQDLPEGTELRLQNRELCLSLRQFKQDCESLEAENLSLKEALACMEDDLHRVSDQHAQLVGHVNHRQKIRYTMKLKEEINRLHGDLKKARQRIVQLEVNKESDSLFEALASVVGGESYTTASKARRGSRLATSQRRGSVAATRPPRRGEVVSREDDQVRLAEAEQLCMLQQSALDRISMDFQHLKALIERAVQLADAERRHGVEGGNFAALLHRLREIIAANHRNPSSGGNTDDLGRLPVTATSITCDDDDEELAEGDTVCYGCPEQQDHAVEELG